MIRSVLLTLGALLALAAAGLAETSSPVCAEPTPLTVLAMDTASGLSLLALTASEAGGSFLVEVGSSNDHARAFGGFTPGERFSGSIGPGPILALRRCGEGCVQAEAWSDGTWSPRGETLKVPATANLHLTYDRAGKPWLAVHALTQERGLTDVAAYRLEGGSWKVRGRVIVHASGTPAVYPAPWREDAIVSGSALFSATESPSYWLQGMPPTPEPNRGNLIALGAELTALLAEDGTLFHSRDRGATWYPQRWRPWGEERTPLWTYGTDYALDLPLGTLAGPLPTIWFDSRPLREPELHLAELTPEGTWRRLADSVPNVESPTGEPLEVVTFLHTAGGRWLLLSDCYQLQGQPGFTLRTLPPLGLSRPKFVPIVSRLP